MRCSDPGNDHPPGPQMADLFAQVLELLALGHRQPLALASFDALLTHPHIDGLLDEVEILDDICHRAVLVEHQGTDVVAEPLRIAALPEHRCGLGWVSAGMDTSDMRCRAKWGMLTRVLLEVPGTPAEILELMEEPSHLLN
jgi:hypothetical protein